MSLRQRAAKGIFWSVIQKWGRAAISILTFVVLSRLLAPEAFGLVALATVFTVFIELFLDQGFGAAIVQRAEIEPRSEEHTSELQSLAYLVCRLLLEKKKR